MSTLIDEPRVVPGARGAAWWAEGWRLFAGGVFAWIGIVIIYMIVTILISMIPYVGDVGHWLLTPVFTAGAMVGCNAIARGTGLKVAHLFEGFQGAHFVPLIIIGAVNMAVVLIIGAIAAAFILGTLHVTDALRLGGVRDPLGAMSSMAGMLGAEGLVASLLLLVIAALFGMLNWFAPALVILRGAKPIDAMRLSFVACWRNWVPFLIYGLVAVGLALCVTLVIGGLIFGLGATAFWEGSGGWGALIGLIILLGFILFLATLVGLPVFFGSTYAGFRDIFPEPAAEPVNVAPAFVVT